MEIVSSAFDHGHAIPKKYTCEGANINPPLQFKGVPAEARSLVLLVEDPDASSVRPWVHWLVFNISPEVNTIEENTIPKSCTEGLSTGNIYGYEGPCPPSGKHHYHFRLHALDSMLDLPMETDRKAILKAMEGKVITEAVLTGFFEKSMQKQSMV